MKAYAQLYELELLEVIADAGESAKSLERPGLQEALAMLKAKEADALLVVKLDRLTRSVRDLGHLVEKYFAPGKAALLSVGEQIDTRSATLFSPFDALAERFAEVMPSAPTGTSRLPPLAGAFGAPRASGGTLDD